MREQLIQYVDLLFAGAPDAADIKQEILQNTLDRYDDLIAQGKSPQAAYQLAISGIGDVSELLGNQRQAQSQSVHAALTSENEKKYRWIKAVAIAFFILCAVPILILENTIGVCLCLAMVAAGVALLTVHGKQAPQDSSSKAEPRRSSLNRGINGGIWGVGLCIYFLSSFSTGDWHITWLIFPILGCICGLVDAIFDIKKSTISSVVRMIIFALLLLLLFTCVLGLSLGTAVMSGWFGNSMSGDFSTSSGSVIAEEIRDLEIEWVSGSITIKPANTEVISFQETSYGDSKPMIWKQSGDKLIIQFAESSVHFGIFSTNTVSKDLTITVPEEWIGDELTIESVSASIEVTGLTCNEIDLNNVSGECDFINCNVVELTLETVSGGIDFRGTLDSLDCDSVSADCEIYVLNEPRKIDMDGVSCDLILYLPESCGFTVQIDSMSGYLNSAFSTTTKNGKYVYGNGNCQIDADSMSGDIIIRKAG